MAFRVYIWCSASLHGLLWWRRIFRSWFSLKAGQQSASVEGDVVIALLRCAQITSQIAQKSGLVLAKTSKVLVISLCFPARPYTPTRQNYHIIFISWSMMTELQTSRQLERISCVCVCVRVCRQYKCVYTANWPETPVYEYTYACAYLHLQICK